MFFLPFMPPQLSKKEIASREQQECERRQRLLQEWSPKIKWATSLVIRGESYKPPSLFEVKPTKHKLPQVSLADGEALVSPCGNWMYREIVLPEWGKLLTLSGSKQGDVMFDGDVLIPIINRKYLRHDAWKEEPWMSLTPMELITMRTGVRHARGRVVVAGLGMGHQLQEVCKKRTVKEVVLVERDQGIIDWITPQLDTRGKLVKIICGDAYKEVPKLTADTALIDIFDGYGNNTFSRCQNINNVWIWGSAPIADGGYW